MAKRSRSSTKGSLWHGYRRPLWRDGALWFAVAVTGVALAVQQSWTELDRGSVGIALFAADVLVTAVITFALVGVLAGTVRGFGEGWRAAPAPLVRRSAPRPPSPAESPSGAKPSAEPVGRGERPALGIELEKKARALGRAVGATHRRVRKD